MIDSVFISIPKHSSAMLLRLITLALGLHATQSFQIDKNINRLILPGDTSIRLCKTPKTPSLFHFTCIELYLDLPIMYS
jgi:hypothetical protein